jgi:thiol-disulfide isomerase/thioredoxin
MSNGLPENKSHFQGSSLEILLFVSPWSLSCYKAEKDLFQTINNKKLPIKITKINAETDPDIADKYDIVTYPTLVFRNFMKVVGGCKREELEEIVSLYFAKNFEL